MSTPPVAVVSDARDAAPRGPRARDLRALGAVMAVGAIALPRLPAVGPLCPMRRLTGVPCPFCGMTTGVLALARGDVGAALAANPASAVLVFAVLVALLPASLRTRALPRPPAAAAGLLPWLAGPLWVFELHRHDLI